EFLDAEGTPRLRIAPPRVVDATGATHAAELHVDRCAVDSDPRPPWGRAVTRPGAPACEVRVAWSGARYPVIVDPGWSTTGSMASPREKHAAQVLENNHVLVSGGSYYPAAGGVVTLSACELYDPATSTWAATGSMAATRTYHTASRLGSGKVVVAGGDIEAT